MTNEKPLTIKPLDGPSDFHQCIATRHGDWIVYECPKCDYQFHDNSLTGEFQVQNAKVNISHSGRHTDSTERLN